MSKLFKALTPKPAKPRAGGAHRSQAEGVDREKLDRAARDGTARDGTAGPTPRKTGSEAGEAKEIGGPDGPEPTRYGDWERGGICYDF